MHAGSGGRRHGDAEGNHDVRTTPPHFAEQQGKGKAQHQNARQDHCRHAATLVEPRKGHIPEPLPRVPGLARFREGVEVRGWNAAISQNPLSGADVPPGIPVPEQPLGAVQAQKQEN